MAEEPPDPSDVVVIEGEVKRGLAAEAVVRVNLRSRSHGELDAKNMKPVFNAFVSASNKSRTRVIAEVE